MSVGNTAICLISSTFVSVCVRGKSSRCVSVSLMSSRPHRLPFLFHGIFTVCWNSGLNLVTPGALTIKKAFYSVYDNDSCWAVRSEVNIFFL